MSSGDTPLQPPSAAPVSCHAPLQTAHAAASCYMRCEAGREEQAGWEAAPPSLRLACRSYAVLRSAARRSAARASPSGLHMRLWSARQSAWEQAVPQYQAALHALARGQVGGRAAAAWVTTGTHPIGCKQAEPTREADSAQHSLTHSLTQSKHSLPSPAAAAADTSAPPCTALAVQVGAVQVGAGAGGRRPGRRQPPRLQLLVRVPVCKQRMCQGCSGWHHGALIHAQCCQAGWRGEVKWQPL